LTGLLDFERFSQIKQKLPPLLKQHYEVYSQVDPLAVDNLYRESDLVIGRAGANTVSEILTTKRPAILIPIPWTYLDEQTKNAEFAQKFGIAQVIKEDNLTPQRLNEAIERSIKDWKKIVEGVTNKPSPDAAASEKLTSVFKEISR
jgi:UDP-N-acetylglucosamine--N-acetylmuramyl-(pentapeptide) pyrophosphoryl-undecaprenol N-acetylglucosamine transferase